MKNHTHTWGFLRWGGSFDLATGGVLEEGYCTVYPNPACGALVDFVAVHKVGLASRGVGERRPAVLRTKVAPYMSHQVWSLTELCFLCLLQSRSIAKIVVLNRLLGVPRDSL